MRAVILVLLACLLASCGQEGFTPAAVVTAPATDLAPPPPAEALVFRLGGPGEDSGQAVVADAAGNLFVAGHFTHQNELATSQGGQDVFLARYDGQGSLVWSLGLGSAGHEQLATLLMDEEGNLYLGGTFEGRVAFDPTTELVAAGLSDAFLASYDPDGKLRWARTLGAAGQTTRAHDLALGERGALYLTGDFTGTVQGLVSAGDTDGLLVRYDLAGQPEWLRRFGGPGPDSGRALAAVADTVLVCEGSQVTRWSGAGDPGPGVALPGQAHSLAGDGLGGHVAVGTGFLARYGPALEQLWSVSVSKLTNQLGLKVYLGLFLFPGHNDWTADNYANYVKPAVARGNISALIVGNEDPQDLALILSYLDKARTDFPKLPASSAQTTTFWLTDAGAAQLAAKVDFIAVNIYPGWDGVPWAQMNLQPVIGGKPATAADSFNSFKIIYGKVAAKYPGLPIVVTETGWPTTYGAPSPAPPQPKTGIDNAKAYLTLVQNWATTNKKNVFIYGMYDDTNAVNTSSLFNYHFGLMDTDGKSKGVLF